MKFTAIALGLILSCHSILAETSTATAKEKQAKRAKSDAVQITDQPPQPVISYVYPAGGQRGTTVSALIGGTNLVTGTNLDVTLHFSGRGVTAHALKADSVHALRIAIEIAPDAELGEHTLRLVTQGGGSNRYRFMVGDLPEINEAEPNSTKDKAQPLPNLPIVVNGQIQQEDRDYLRFSAKAGQTLVLSVQARALLPFLADAVPGWFDPVLTVFDTHGKKLACVDDYHLQPDPVLFFNVPANGDYVVELIDSIYRGREDFVYRLTVGELPWVENLYPLGGRRGETTLVNLRGVNLPTNQIAVALPTNALATQPVNITSGSFISNPLPFGAGDCPEVTELEPNDATNQATRVIVPATINGRINHPGDDDWFVFNAKEGEKLIMEVTARRLDSPLDSILTLFNAKGVELMQNDDTVDPFQPQMTHHADSRLVYTAQTTGDYFLRVRDVQNKGGDDFAYRLVIAPPQPDFALRFSPDNPRASRGDSAVFNVTVLRRDGFDRNIDLSVEGLPNGFRASDAIIQTNQDQVSLTVTVPLDAPEGMVEPRIIGKSTDGLTRTAQPAEAMMQAFAYTHLMPSDECLLTILNPGSLTLAADLGTNTIFRVAPGTTNTFPVRVVRKENVRGGVAIAVSKPPQGINARAAFIQPDKDEGIVTVIVQKQARPGLRFNLILSGTLRSGRGGSLSTAPAVPVEVVAAER